MVARWLQPHFLIACVWPLRARRTIAPLHCAANFDCPPPSPSWRNPMKGRDQVLPSGNLGQKDPIGHNHNAKSEQRNLARRPNERNCFSRMPLAHSLAQRSRLTFKRIFVEFSPRGISNPGECRHLGQRDNRATRSRPSWRRLR